MVSSAIQEVSLHVLSSAYTSSNPIVKVIFERISAGAIEEIHLFDLKANEISRNTLMTAMGIRIEPLIMGIPEFAGNWAEYQMMRNTFSQLKAPKAAFIEPQNPHSRHSSALSQPESLDNPLLSSNSASRFPVFSLFCLSCQQKYAPFQCTICEMFLPSCSFTMQCWKGCKVCDDCRLASPVYTGQPITCPNCKCEDDKSRSRIIENMNNRQETMRIMGDCKVCKRGILRFCMLRANKLHHECSICDQCFLRTRATTRCPVCAMDYDKHDGRYLAKLLPISGISEGKMCACGSEIRDEVPNCTGKCRCIKCIYEDYLINGKLYCYRCDTAIIPMAYPSVVECSGCMQPLAAGKAAGICLNGCILCCFCIKLNEKNEGLCANCLIPMSSLKAADAREQQESFSLACYCGKPKENDTVLPCGHIAHKSCISMLFICRICSIRIKDKPRFKTIYAYLPSI